MTHVIRVPSVPEEEWIAHLRQRRLDEEREDRERAIENQRRAEQRHQHCAAHHEDTGCWGPGGYEGAVRRMEEAARRPRRPAPVQVAVAPPEPPRPRTPEGPPPPPQAERRPPQPSLHATWVTGYWRWHAERWVWVGGIWDVPEEDLIAEATVQAPEAPPPARVEVRAAAPAPDMVWVPGYWQWDGARFAWIDGRWDLPRREGTVWQAPTWRPRARGGVAFVPGGWVVTVRR
ncbi:MAG: YXWGXW repeat-containing protein [Sandaracinaceae bacterium]